MSNLECPFGVYGTTPQGEPLVTLASAEAAVATRDAEIASLSADLATARGLVAQAEELDCDAQMLGSVFHEDAAAFLSGAKPAARWQTVGSVDVLSTGEVLGVCLDALVSWHSATGPDGYHTHDSRDAARAWVKARAKRDGE